MYYNLFENNESLVISLEIPCHEMGSPFGYVKYEFYLIAQIIHLFIIYLGHSAVISSYSNDS